jgi:hypothetical protein
VTNTGPTVLNGNLGVWPGAAYNTLASSAQLTGMLTLNAQNDPNAAFVFQIGSTLTTASNSSVVVANGEVTTWGQIKGRYAGDQ